MEDLFEYLSSKGLNPKQAGEGNLRMLCPFHGEEEGRPGRLYVQAEDGDKYGLFFCHVCTARGTINKIRKHFGDSLLDINPNEEANPIVEVAAQYYHDRLFEHYEAYLYLEEERGLNEKTIVQARLGYADGNLGLHLLQKGYLPEQIKESGLMKIDGTDYFKDEIIFPYLKYGRAMQLRGKKIGGKTRSMAGIKAMLYNGDAILGEDTVTVEEGECFPPETEILTEFGWRRFDELADERVAQVDENSNVIFVKPLAKIEKDFSGELIHLQNSQRFSSLTTPGHNIPIWKNKDGVKTWKKYQANALPHEGNINRIGIIDGSGVAISNTEIRFLLAIAADFTLEERKQTGNNVGKGRIYAKAAFTRDRKKKAIIEILNELGIQYKTAPFINQSGNKAIYIHFSLPEKYTDPSLPTFASKILPWSWVNEMTLQQKQFVLAEQALWDGNHVPNRNQVEFSSKHYSEVLWMQTMACAAGYCATIIPRTNKYGHWFKVSILFGKSYTGLQALHKHTANVPYDGKVYCVTVPTGMILVRHDGCISVSGNCDVLTMQQLGYNAVGVPGALVWKPEWTDQLEDAKRVYILFDADSAGRSGAEKLAQTIGPRSRIVELPKKGIDVNDYFVKYAKQREDFDWLFSKAKGGLLVTVQQSFESWTEIEGNPDLAGLRFNIGPMDKVLQFGLLPGDIMTVLARTNVGKSLWVINMTHRMRMADPNFKCLFVSLEQTRSAWFERAHRIHNFYNPGETVMSTVDYWKDNILLIDKNKISEGQLIDSIEQFAYEIGEVPSTVVVDYLGYYARSFPGNSKEQTTDAIMGLKSMAKDIGVSIVAPAQANRTGEIGEELTLEMCKDAATIEETSDLLISLWSRDQKIAKEDEDERTNMVNQRILKSRQGGLMSLMQYQMAPLTLALVPSDDELYDRAVKERSYALQGLNWKEAVQLHMNNQVAF